MNKFEENLDAWLAGRLHGQELEQFEASLPEISAAQLEQQQQELKLGAFLKDQLTAPAMTNVEFFHHQLRRQMESETAATAKPQHIEAPVRETWWSISRLLWTGATSLAVFAVCTFFVMRETPNGGQSAYFAQITNARIDPAVSPNATISVFPVENQEQKVTVLWVEGLQSLPSEYAAK
ncbi:MAG TPA: hypothetical protein VF551_02595 [Chthoniobacterales bacterium]